MNDILAVYLKAYTSKKAADSVADDMAVGTGIGLLGGLAGYTRGKARGEKLRQTKAPKIEHALDRIRARIDEIKLRSEEVRKRLNWNTEYINKYNNAGLDPSWYESNVKKYKNELDKLQQSAIKQNDRYFKTWGKADKLQKAIKNSRRIGGFAGAFSVGLLSTLLYNKLKKD